MTNKTFMELLVRLHGEERATRTFAASRRVSSKGAQKNTRLPLYKLIVLDSIRVGNSTLRGISADTGIKKGTVSYIVTSLKKSGHVSASPFLSSTIRLTKIGRLALISEGFGRCILRGKSTPMVLIIVSQADYQPGQTSDRTEV